MKENMMTRIKQERAGRTYELQVSAALFAFAVIAVIMKVCIAV